MVTARYEFKFYKGTLIKGNEIRSPEFRHFIFDFTENVLLPKL